MLSENKQQQKPRPAGDGGRVARKRVGKKSWTSIYGPTILWDEWNRDFLFEVTPAVLAGATNPDEMATLCLAGDTEEQLQDDFRREMSIDRLKRASRDFDPSSYAPGEREALQAIEGQLDVEMYLYHQALVASGRERKWPIFVRMYGFLAFQAESMVGNGKCIVLDVYEDDDTTPVD